MYEDLKLNPISINLNDRYKFWEVFLGILQVIVPKERRLNPTEIKVLTHVLVKDPFKSHFKGKYRVRLREELNDISSVRLSQIKGRLIHKGWIDDELPVRNLRNIQKKLEEKMTSGRIKLRMQYIFNLYAGK